VSITIKHRGSCINKHINMLFRQTRIRIGKIAITQTDHSFTKKWHKTKRLRYRRERALRRLVS